jgi:hypothetical protein
MFWKAHAAFSSTACCSERRDWLALGLWAGHLCVRCVLRSWLRQRCYLAQKLAACLESPALDPVALQLVLMLLIQKLLDGAMESEAASKQCISI